MTQEIAKRDTVLENVALKGDLKDLSSADRVAYYAKVCQSLGLNPYTRPFEYLELNHKLILYARREATEQLRQLHNVSITITGREMVEGVYVVTAKASAGARTDESIGAVDVSVLKGEFRANAMMKAECVPLDSEILTRDGFKCYDEVRVGDEVLAYDVDTDECQWTPLLDVSIFAQTPIVRLHSTKGRWEVRCTPDHSWAVACESYRIRSTGQRPIRGPYANRGPARQLVKSNMITKSHRIILASSEKPTLDSLLTPVEAAILGWAVTDGTIKRVGNYVRIGISQSKERNFDDIRELVGAVAPGTKEFIGKPTRRTFPTGKTCDCLPQSWWYLPSAISKAILERAGFHDQSDLPGIVTRLDSPARKAMLQSFMLAEGDARKVFYNGDPCIREAYQILCALEGIATGKDTRHIGDVTRQRMKLTRHVAGHFLESEPAGETSVWCPTTQYGTWVMRQEGRVMITGNTKAKRRVTLSIVGLGWLDESEISDIPLSDRKAVQVSPTTGEIIEAEVKQIEAPLSAEKKGSTPQGGIDIEVIAQLMVDKGLKTAGEQRQWIAKTFPGMAVSGPIEIIIGELPVDKQQELCRKLEEK